MIDALRINLIWSLKKKKQFWNKYFMEPITEFFKLDYKDNNPKRILNMLRNFEYLEAYDHNVWAKLIKLLRNKRGWMRIEIYELMSRHMDRFPEAQELVDKIYQ